MSYNDTESSAHIPSSSGLVSFSQSSTNTGDVLGAWKYARATSFAMICLVFTFLDFPVAALLMMYLSIFIGDVDEKESGSL